MALPKSNDDIQPDDLQPDDLCPQCLEPIDDCTCDPAPDENELIPEALSSINNLGYLGVEH